MFRGLPCFRARAFCPLLALVGIRSETSAMSALVPRPVRKHCSLQDLSKTDHGQNRVASRCPRQWIHQPARQRRCRPPDSTSSAFQLAQVTVDRCHAHVRGKHLGQSLHSRIVARSIAGNHRSVFNASWMRSLKSHPQIFFDVRQHGPVFDCQSQPASQPLGLPGGNRRLVLRTRRRPTRSWIPPDTPTPLAGAASIGRVSNHAQPGGRTGDRNPEPGRQSNFGMRRVRSCLGRWTPP